MRCSRVVAQIAILPTIHLCLCILTRVFLGDDSWDWIYVATLDGPLIGLMGFFKEPPFGILSITVCGTIWWLCVSIALFALVRLFARIKKAVTSK